MLENISPEAFKTDWQRQWLVQRRGVEIISETSRYLTAEVKARHSENPWQKVAAISNVLRHNYENIAASGATKSSSDRAETLAARFYHLYCRRWFTSPAAGTMSFGKTAVWPKRIHCIVG